MQFQDSTGVKANLWSDGSLDLTGTLSAASLASSGRMWIGADSGSSLFPFNISQASTTLPRATVTGDTSVVGWYVQRTGGTYPIDWYMGVRENTKNLSIFDNINGTEAVLIESNTGNATFAGNVGIGTTSFTSGLTVSKEGSNTTDGVYFLVDSDNASFGGNAVGAGFKYAGALGNSFIPFKITVGGTTINQISSTGVMYVGNGSTTYGFHDPYYTFTHDTNTGMDWAAADTLTFKTGGTERMRIDSSGNLRLGTTTGNADAKMTIYGGSTDSSPSLELFKGSTTNTTSQVFMRFEIARDTTPVASGSITANGAAAATFTAWSDRKLKENIVDLSPQLENICKLKPSEFDFIGYPEGEGHQIGFIAQDMQEVYPDVVSEGKNGMLQISGWSKTEARLVKALQEAVQKIEALEARITSLETN
jgi:hypothetical protein